MKHFPELKTARLSVTLRELSIGQAIAVAGFPNASKEAERTKFLREAIASVGRGPADPAEWTVQERSFCVALYLAATLIDGPDFSVGDHHYSDYLDAEADGNETITEIGNIGGDDWSVQHLTGGMAEAIERIVGEIDVPARYHWLLGAMSAQLIRAGDEAVEVNSSEYDQWLLARMRVFNEFPESDFEILLSGYYEGRAVLHHLFDYEFSDDGIVILPRQGGAGISPAVFPVRRCISAVALGMAGKLGRYG